MARPRSVTDEQILEATRATVLERGVQVPLDSVADELGVTTPALLKRFGTRQALLVAALKPDLREFEANFAPSPDPVRPFEDQLEGLIDRLSNHFAKVFPCMMALRECGYSPEQLDGKDALPRPVYGVRLMARWLERCLEAKLIDTEAIETAATAILGAISTRSISAHLMHKPWSSRSQRDYQRELAMLFSRALKADHAGQVSHRRTVSSRTRKGSKS